MPRRLTYKKSRSKNPGDSIQGPRRPQPKPEPTPAPKPEPKPAMPAPTYDSQYTADVAGADLEYGTAVNQINTSRDRLGFDTGYNAQGQIDTRNPYSQAMALQRGWEQDQRGVSTSMAARGQLYSGARQRGLNESTYNYERNRSGLATSAQRGYEDLTTAEQAAGAQRTQGHTQAGASQATRWSEAERDWHAIYG